MEFNQLESFLSVVKHKSFTRAARDLYLTQPSVSNNIQNLEKELNTTLINRTARDISLTDSGKIFYKYALELMNLRDKARFEISDHASKIDGKIEILSSSIPEQYVLPYILRDFKNLYQNTSFIVSQMNSKDIINNIIQGRENFGIVGAKLPSKALDYIAFYEDDIVLALPASSKYPESFTREFEIESIFSEQFLLRKENSGTRSFIEKSLAEINVSLDDLNVFAILDSNEMIKKMIEIGEGISFLPHISIRNEIKLGLIKAFKLKNFSCQRKFYFVYSRHRTLPPNVEAFKDFLTKWTGI